MDEIIHVGFESGSRKFDRDMMVDELIGLIVEHAIDFEEAIKATEMIHSLWTAGRFDGTGWSFWFTRREPVVTFH